MTRPQPQNELEHRGTTGNIVKGHETSKLLTEGKYRRFDFVSHFLAYFCNINFLIKIDCPRLSNGTRPAKVKTAHLLQGILTQEALWRPRGGRSSFQEPPVSPLFSG